MTFLGGPSGKISTDNSTSSTLAGDATYTGTREDVSNHSNITIIIKTDKDSDTNGVTFNFSSDNSNNDKIFKYTIFADQTKTYTFPVYAQYFQVIYTNGSDTQGTFRLQTILHNTKNTSEIGPINSSGSQLVKLDNTKSAFGEIYVTNLEPIVEMDFVYGINPHKTDTITRGNALVTSNTPFVDINSSTDATGFASIKSVNLANYRPGQGIDVRFTTIFDTAVADSIQIVGVGDESNGFFFGYNGTSFGILRRTDGSYEVQTLTLTTGATSTGSVDIELNGTTYGSVDVTQSLTLAENAKEIANNDYTGTGDGWITYANGNEVIFVSMTSGVKNGAYSFVANSTGTVASFSSDVVGAAATDNWTAQSSWNIDLADGTDELPNMVFTNGNVFQIKYQWLGFGMIIFSLENPLTGEFQDVHRIRYANSATTTSIANPKMPLYANITKTSGASGLTMQIPSMCCLLAGKKPTKLPVTHSTSASQNFNSTTLKSILSIRNKLFFNSTYNTVNVDLTNIVIHNEHSKSAEFQVIRNSVLKGNITWSNVDTHTLIESNSTEADITDDGTVVYSTILATNTSETINNSNIQLILRPGDTLTIAAKHLTSASPSVMAATVNWIDDF